MIKKYADLPEKTKQDVRRRYVNWKWDKTSKTFEDWANKHAFYVTKNGALDNRYNHCEDKLFVDITGGRVTLREIIDGIK